MDKEISFKIYWHSGQIKFAEVKIMLGPYFNSAIRQFPSLLKFPTKLIPSGSLGRTLNRLNNEQSILVQHYPIKIEQIQKQQPSFLTKFVAYKTDPDPDPYGSILLLLQSYCNETDKKPTEDKKTDENNDNNDKNPDNVKNEKENEDMQNIIDEIGVDTIIKEWEKASQYQG
ncbi:hypothetical protein ACFLZV_06785 [Candidatus Margulisiibacteriota bacterium]